jgi:hypothetical protein
VQTFLGGVEGKTAYEQFLRHGSASFRSFRLVKRPRTAEDRSERPHRILFFRANYWGGDKIMGSPFGFGYWTNVQ